VSYAFKIAGSVIFSVEYLTPMYFLGVFSYNTAVLSTPSVNLIYRYALSPGSPFT
jgi:hypothetical protein